MAETNRKRPLFIIGLFVIFVILFLTVLGPYYDFQQIVLFILIPILFIIALKDDIRTSIKGNKELILFILFFCLSLTSIFYRFFSYKLFTINFNVLLGALIASYIPLGLNKNKNYEVFFHIGFIVSIIALISIEYSLGNFNFFGFTNINVRRDAFFYNANYYNYISFFANFSLFYLRLKYRNLITLIALIILPLLFVVLAFITQSRAGLILTILSNILFWFYVDKTAYKNVFTKIAKSILIVVISIFLVIQFVQTYQNSEIKNRVAKTANDSRGDLVMEGLNVFIDHPFIGVGLGQFPNYSKHRQFTHNSFTEVMAEHGFIGCIFIFSLFLLPTFKSFNYLKLNRRNSIAKLNFIFFISFLLYNNFYVFYKASFAMLYFFLIISIQNNSKIAQNNF